MGSGWWEWSYRKWMVGVVIQEVDGGSGHIGSGQWEWSYRKWMAGVCMVGCGPTYQQVLSKREFTTTVTEDVAIARLAIHG